MNGDWNTPLQFIRNDLFAMTDLTSTWLKAQGVFDLVVFDHA